MKFSDIKQLTIARYIIDTPWRYLEENLSRYKKDYGLDMNPDFQRDYVWTEQQQIDYVEWIMRGGQSGKDIYFNCSGWMSRIHVSKNMVIVDGKQRIHAVLAFLHGDIPAYDTYIDDYKDKEIMLRALMLGFRFNINNLTSRTDVLQWYIDMNTGGTQHTSKEIENVQNLLQIEKNKKR